MTPKMIDDLPPTIRERALTEVLRVAERWASFDYTRSISAVDVLSWIPGEVREACAELAKSEVDPVKIEEELADVLWSAVLAIVVAGRLEGVNPARVFRRAGEKILRRCPWMRGVEPIPTSRAEAQAIWNQAKTKEQVKEHGGE